jgi:hypothetical protein
VVSERQVHTPVPVRMGKRGMGRSPGLPDRVSARSSTFIVSEFLFPIRSHGERYLKDPVTVLVESTSRSAPYTTPGDTHANLNRLKANLSRLNESLSANYPAKRARITALLVGEDHIPWLLKVSYTIS